jgi:hypothetical protein
MDIGFGAVRLPDRASLSDVKFFVDIMFGVSGVNISGQCRRCVSSGASSARIEHAMALNKRIFLPSHR